MSLALSKSWHSPWIWAHLNHLQVDSSFPKKKKKRIHFHSAALVGSRARDGSSMWALNSPRIAPQQCFSTLGTFISPSWLQQMIRFAHWDPPWHYCWDILWILPHSFYGYRHIPPSKGREIPTGGDYHPWLYKNTYSFPWSTKKPRFLGIFWRILKKPQFRNYLDFFSTTEKFLIL